MIAEIKLYKNKEGKDGYPVVFYFRNKTVRKRLALGFNFKLSEWNHELNMPLPRSSQYDLVYPKLMNYKYQIQQLKIDKIENYEAYAAIFSADSAAEIVVLQKRLNELQNEATAGILQFFDVVIHEKIQKNESTKFYKETKKQVEVYIVEDMPLNLIDYDWLNGFILFKKAQGTGDAGIMAYLRTIRALYKEAQKRPSLKIKAANPFLGLIKNVQSDKVVEILPSDFEKLQKYTPSPYTNKTAQYSMKRAVDLWIFQFVIGGHDFADVASLTWSNLINERLQFKRYKNRNKPNGGVLVNNKLMEFAKMVVENYGTPNEARIFGFIPAPGDEVKYQTFRGNYNRTLRNISKSENLTTIIKSKSPRYVFRSWGGELLINDLVIMQLQGHKPTGVSFSYQQGLPTSIIDQHHKIIVEKAAIEILPFSSFSS